MNYFNHNYYRERLINKNAKYTWLQYGQEHFRFISVLTFRHRSFSMQDRRFATLQRTLFIYLINKYISLSDICFTVHH